MCSAVDELIRCLNCRLGSACAGTAKLLLEVAIQYAYYTLLGVSIEEALRRIRRRSRSAASFTATMIARLRGVHGSRKKWVLRTYLSIAELVHPSSKLHEAGLTMLPSNKLLLELGDAVIYLVLVSGDPVSGKVLDLSTSCGFEKSLKLIERRGNLVG
jgi:hypothetical protein